MSIVEVAEGIKPEVVGFLFVNPTHKISDLLRSAFGIALSPPERHRTLTHSCNQCAWCVPQKSIGGAVGATLGNAPYGDCDRNRLFNQRFNDF
ncbi:hypothetical protein [Microcystis sp. LE19-195.1E]|uniref:hypothetical protein n=1 Tax=Microcystis sp. LE19-195.1E TaxID=3016440 RepID=UPI0022C2673E|nr:hypothetical protein [Microcystis sp. LE19-195.1E]MCZ8248236.1 hypothetical protein [Microcystis sp. LE19-195.1E]